MTAVDPPKSPAQLEREHFIQYREKGKGLEWLIIEPGGYKWLLKNINAIEDIATPVPTQGQCLWLVRNKGDNALISLFKRRNEGLTKERGDPFNHGFRPKQWAKANSLRAPGHELFISGPNRSSKSEYASFECVEVLTQKPASIVWCMASSDERSKDVQQRYVFKYLPLAWKNPRKSKGIKFNTRTRFSDNFFVAPNGSECIFKNCNQDAETTLEGGQVDLIWIDEGVDMDRLTRLRGRTIDRAGEIIWTYTPIDGYTLSVADFFDGSTVQEWTDCPPFANEVIWRGGKPGMAPVVLKCLDERKHVIFFDSRQNPYIKYSELLKKWQNSPRSVRLARLAGITEKTAGTVMPRFGLHNIISAAKAEEAFEANPPTRYHFLDFAWNRNWFMLWFAVQRIKDKKRIVVYREWPDFDNYGEWVLPTDKPDGGKGPAQTTQGFGTNDYKRVCYELENKEPIFMRYGDPRSAAAKALADEGTTTILDLLLSAEAGLAPMIVQPAISTDGKGTIVEGVTLINKWLEYNEEQPISVANEPMLYIVDRCKNLISCMKMWTGKDGDKGASKDPIDLLRYAAVLDIDYYDPDRPLSWGGGSY